LNILSDVGIAFFDEPTQNMDEVRRRNLATQLSRIGGFKQIFVISHDDTFEEMVENAIKVRKENGVSRVG
jgi:exonuclease SbcC